MKYEWVANVIIIIFLVVFLIGVIKLTHHLQDEEEKRYKGNNYTLVNYTANGDTIAVYEKVKDYYFDQPSIIIIFEDKKQIVVSGNYTLFDKSKR